MAVLGDYSSAASINDITSAYTDATGVDGTSNFSTYRGFGADWFNASGIAAEDYANNEASAYNSWLRELYSQQQSQEWQEYYDGTQYQRTVADLQAAGLNPILAYSNGSNSSSSSSASGGSSSQSGSSRVADSGALVGTLLSVAKIVAGAVTGQAQIAAMGAAELANNAKANYYNSKTLNKYKY